MALSPTYDLWIGLRHSEAGFFLEFQPARIKIQSGNSPSGLSSPFEALQELRYLCSESFVKHFLIGWGVKKSFAIDTAKSTGTFFTDFDLDAEKDKKDKLYNVASCRKPHLCTS